MLHIVRRICKKRYGLFASNRRPKHLSFSSLRRLSERRKTVILGIETSCDDTGCAVVNEQGTILGESLKSQGQIHVEMGGINPPMAQMFHIELIDEAVSEALSRARLTLNEVDAIATTVKPGLPLSLRVGADKGKSLSVVAAKPFIPIHHMEAHALTVRMVEKVEFPFLVLLISGGHCLVSVARDVDNFLLLGETLDDAPGEAYDKIARRLKLSHQPEYRGLCGGEALERAAKKGDPESFPVAEPLLRLRNCMFSFAGVKNSSRKLILREEETHGVKGDEVIPSVNDLCASIQYAIIKHLCRRLQRAMDFVKNENLLPSGNYHLVVSGGVASNKTIQNALRVLCQANNFTLHVPPRKLCTDNGVMIAWNGVEKFLVNRGILTPDEATKVDIEPKCPFGEDMTNMVGEANLKGRRLPLKEIIESLRDP